jgi:hypothetical protein
MSSFRYLDNASEQIYNGITLLYKHIKVKYYMLILIEKILKLYEKSFTSDEWKCFLWEYF